MKEVDSTRSILRNEAEIIFRTFKYLPNINCVLYIPAHNSSYPRKFGKRKKKKGNDSFVTTFILILNQELSKVTTQ